MAFGKIETCIICEAVRPELYNKNILLGFFGIAPFVKVRLANVNAPATLCFVFSGAAPTSTGKFNVRLRLIDPSGREITNPQNSAGIKDGVLAADKGPTNIFLGFQGILGMTGTYRVALIVDGVEHYNTSIGIEQGVLSQTLVH